MGDKYHKLKNLENHSTAVLALFEIGKSQSKESDALPREADEAKLSLVRDSNRERHA